MAGLNTDNVELSPRNDLDSTGKGFDLGNMPELKNPFRGVDLTAKPPIIRGNLAGSNLGITGGDRPFLVIKRPVQSIPNQYDYYNGYPSNMYYSLGTIHGLVIIDRIELNNIKTSTGKLALSDEIDMLNRILKSGVRL